ncbi:hypothetical protein [Terrisporobacter petrolearius]
MWFPVCLGQIPYNHQLSKINITLSYKENKAKVTGIIFLLQVYNPKV